MRAFAIGKSAFALALGVAAIAAAPSAAADLPAELTQLPRPILSFTGITQNESAGTPFQGREGRPIAQHCDVDDDGIDDLVFAAHGFDNGNGRIFFQRGGPGLAGGVLTQTPTTVIASGFEDTKSYGTWTDCAGDFDGDGIDDVVVSSDGNGSGKEVPVVYVLLGSAQFFSRQAIDVGEPDPRVIPIGPPVGSFNGAAAPIGDVDGDGKADLAMAMLWPSGKVYLVAGRAATGAIDPTDPAQAREILSGVNTFPTTLTGVGDLDGDGLGELAVANADAANYRGRIEIVSGAFLADDSAPSFNLPGETAGARVLFRVSGQEMSTTGFSLTGVPDLNGDGRDELALGSIWRYGDSVNDPPLPASAGQVHVVFGTTSHDPIDVSGLGAGGYAITGPELTTHFGTALAASPDLNGDGLAELLIGAELAESPKINQPNNAGRGYVIYGKADTDPISTATLDPTQGSVLYGSHYENRLGMNAAALGDVDGNGLQDLAFAGWSKNFTGRGDVRVVQLGELPKPKPDPEPEPQPTDPGTNPGSGAQSTPAPSPAPGPAPSAKPSVQGLTKQAKLNEKGVASVGLAVCPSDGGTCTVTVPKTIGLKIGGKRFTVTVIAPKTLAAGKRAAIRVKLGEAARERLAGRKATVRVKVEVSNGGGKVNATASCQLG